MQEEFANYIITKDIRFKHAKGMRDIIGQELHTYHEIFFFIDGDTEFVSEYGTQKLLPLTTLIIPKNTFHCFEVHCDEKEYQRCVLNFGSVSELDEIINIKLKHIFITKSKKIADIFIKMLQAVGTQPGRSLLPSGGVLRSLGQGPQATCCLGFLASL